MRFKEIVIILMLLLSNKHLFSQFLFSQFYSSPLTINPANTGNYLRDYRIGGVYRNEQNQSSQNTKSSFFCDTRIFKSSLPENDRLATGGTFSTEKDPFNGVKNSNLLISMAYFKGLNGDGTQHIGAGFQIDFAHKRLEPPNLIFPEQIMSWANSGFVGIVIPSGNVINLNYIDFNTGLNYQCLVNHTSLLNVGISILHVNSPHKVFQGGEFSLSPEVSFQTGFESTVAGKNKFYFDFIMNTELEKKSTDDLIISSIYQKTINNSKYKISVGGLYRKDKLYGESITPSLGLKYNNVNLVLSYDINISSKNLVQKSAMEVGMIFTGMNQIKK